jgi:hypothetical protein
MVEKSMVPQNPKLDASHEAAAPPPGVPSPPDQQLLDWNAYYQLLLAGKLIEYGGEFIVIDRGEVVAHGADLEQLRRQAAAQLGVVAEALVTPFVDSRECIVVG